MKTRLHYLLTLLFIAPLFSLAQCGGTLSIGISSFNSHCEGDPVGIQLSGVGAGWSFKIYKDSISPSSVISDSTYVLDSLTTQPNTVWYATADSSGCTQKVDSVSSVVHPKPIVTATATPDSVCPGQCSQLVCGGSGGLTFTWTPASTLSSTIICNPTACPFVTTTYTLTAVNGFGCAGEGYVTVTVNPLPAVNVSPADTTICEGNYIQFHTSGTGISCTWNPSTGLADSLVCDAIAIASSTITYTLTVSDVNGCTNTATAHITVNPSPPMPALTCSGDTLFCTTDTAYKFYQWYDDTTIINGATRNYLVITHSGAYSVIVSGANGCQSQVGINILGLGLCTVGINDYLLNNLTVIFPNPADKQIKVRSSDFITNEAVTISIINIFGQKISSQVLLQKRGEDMAIDVGNLPSGLYFLQVADEKQRWLGRFVKE